MTNSQALLTDQEIYQLLAVGRALAKRRPDARHSARGRPGQQVQESIGTGMEYADSREYQAGDSPRHINWRASARSSRMQVRQFYSESQTEVFFVIDCRPAMRFGTRRRLKTTQAIRLALVLAAMESVDGARLATLTVDESGVKKTPPLSASAGIRSMLRMSNIAASVDIAEEDHDPVRSLSAFLNRNDVRGQRIYFLSDLTGFDDGLFWRRVGRNTDLRVAQIYASFERAPETRSAIQVRWHGRQQMLHEGVQGKAASDFDHHLSLKAEGVTQSGARYVPLAAEVDDLQTLALELAR